MSLDKVLVIFFGVAGIFFTYWFFLWKKEKEVVVKNVVDITVCGGYSPEVISIPKDKTTKINFTRTDSTECLNEVILSDFKIRKELPLHQKVSIEVTPQERGEYIFTCGMGMYHGKIVVR